MKLCAVCLARPKVGVALCAPCGRSYDNATDGDQASTIGIIIWAAGRARRMDRKRAKEQSGRYAALVRRQDAKRE